MHTKPRIEYLDLAKGICIFLVALFHATAYFSVQMPIAHVFRSIRLPLYFFLSGCFFKPYNGFFDFLKRKTNKLLIPFAFWFLLISIFVVYLYNLLGIHTIYSTPVGPLHDLVTLYKEEDFFNIPIWFLLCLFEINILFYFIHLISYKLSKRYQTPVICILSLLLGIVYVILHNHEIDLPFFIDSALSDLPYFAFGYVCFRHTTILTPNRVDKYIPILLIVLVLFIYFFALKTPISSKDRVDIQDFFCHYLSGFAGASFIILLTKWIKYLPVIRWWGRYSIIILILHGPIYHHFVHIARHLHIMPDQPWIALLIILSLTMLCCSAAIPICKRFFPHVTAQKDLIPIQSPPNNSSIK